MPNVLNPEPESITLNTETETLTLDPATELEQPSFESTSNTAEVAKVIPALDADAPTEPVTQAVPVVEDAKPLLPLKPMRMSPPTIFPPHWRHLNGNRLPKRLQLRPTATSWSPAQ